MDKWRILPWGLLGAFGFFIFAPVLFFGRAFFGEEQSGFYYAISYYVDMALRQGIPLLWQPGYFGGVSTSLQQFYGNFYPINLFLFERFDFFFAHHLSMALATAAGLLFAYWFGRLQGWHVVSSLTLALGYFSATTFAWIQIGTIAAHSFAILPAILFAVHYASRKRGLGYALAIAGAGVSLGIGFLAGFMQIVFYAYVIAGLYAIFLDYAGWNNTVAWYRNLRTSIAYAAITLLGLLVGLQQFLPSAALIDLTIRTGTYAAQNAVYPHLTEIMAYVLPPYFDVPFFGSGHAAGFYVGSIGFVCALLGLIYYRTSHMLFFAGVYAAIAAFAFHLPVFGWVNEHMPPFSHMGGNFRWLVSGAFPLAFVAAAGIEGLLRAPERLGVRARKLVLWGSAGLAFVLVLGSAVLSFIVGRVAQSPEISARLIDWYTKGHTLAYPAEHYMGVFQRALSDFSVTFSLWSPRFLFAVLTWVIACAFFTYAFSRGVSTKVTAYVLGAAMFFIIGGSTMLQWSDLVPQAIYKNVPELAQELTTRESDPHSYRMLGYLVGDGMHTELFSRASLSRTGMTQAHLEAMTNNTNLYWGIERIDGMEPYRLQRYNRLLNTVIAYDWATFAFDRESKALLTSALDKLYNRDVQKQVTVSEKLKDLEARVPLLSMMNVKYVYSPFELPAPSLSLVKKLEVLIEGHILTLYLYENKRVLPRVYFASAPEFVQGSDTEILARMIDTKDFARTTIIECRDCTAPAGAKGSVSVKSYEPGKVTLATRSGKDEWLVLCESMLPGWEAFVDGEPAAIYTANYLFQAIKVPAGEHSVSFAYRDIGVVQLGATGR